MCYSALVEQDIKVVSKHFDRDVVIAGFDEFHDWHSQDPKKFKDVAQHSRIFPYYFAGVTRLTANQLEMRPMRYQLWPSSYRQDPKNLSLFNARVDNLHSPIWGKIFERNHGILLLKKFYEWVEVKDLVQAGVVTLDQVKSEFTLQSEARKKRILDQGKKYAPTKTELMDPLFRKTIISFSAPECDVLFVPVIFDSVKDEEGRQIWSFAVITTDPTPEIQAAGHDRRPTFFTNPQDALKYLRAPGEKMARKDILDLLSQSPELKFHHTLDHAA